MMPDRDKVIKAIEICYTVGHNCTECPLFSEDHCNDKLMHDALALLKAQEPRVMTLEELLALPKDTPVFIEEYNGECGWNVFYGIDEDNEVCFCGFKASADYYDVVSYGQEYICWTSRPTEEQREAVKWE